MKVPFGSASRKEVDCFDEQLQFFRRPFQWRSGGGRADGFGFGDTVLGRARTNAAPEIIGDINVLQLARTKVFDLKGREEMAWLVNWFQDTIKLV